ncbi:MAG: FHA domain-containing protein [Planctomycetota bacterium]|jgi:hypothetical protein
MYASDGLVKGQDMGFVLIHPATDDAIAVEGDSIFAGSTDWKVDLCLLGAGVAEVHSELSIDPHGIRIVSLCADGFAVNGQLVQRALLFDGDRLGIGPFTFLVRRLIGDSECHLRRLPLTLSASGLQAAAEADDRNWIVRTGVMELGPMTTDVLENMISRGEIDAASHVCRVCEGFLHALTKTEENEFFGKSPRTNQAVHDRARPAGFVGILHGAMTQGRRSQHQSRRQRQLIAEPQYFIRWADHEAGPLPRQTVQEYVRQGELAASTPIRLEWQEDWSTAIDLGFLLPCPENESTRRSLPTVSEDKRDRKD